MAEIQQIVLNAGTIQERLLFHLGTLEVRVQFESGYYSRAGTNHACTVYYLKWKIYKLVRLKVALKSRIFWQIIV